MKKLSILGLVLMGASALTAAVLPAKKTSATSEKSLQQQGQIVGQGGVTNCVPGGSGCESSDFTSGLTEANGTTINE